MRHSKVLFGRPVVQDGLPILFTVVNNVVEPELGVTMPRNIVDNIKQYGQQNIFQFCFQKKIAPFGLCIYDLWKKFVP